MLKVKELHTLRLALIAHKATHHKSKESNYALNTFQSNFNIHGRNTRSRANFFVANAAYSKNNKISECASLAWNSINNNLKMITKRDIFKNKLTDSLLNMYNS